ncbi:unnamed protein product [Brachionus calyciflorus]|uniref:START domain-containing protein n=1 Tax=Brachionus calyciflorus TaxID=104777 RepID=A0A814GDW7_9BILA|nr:unnamed protein product [Brachionus calyciflorus]
MLKLGEVKLPIEKDFEFIRNFCTSDEGWSLENSKKNMKIYTKQDDKFPYKALKCIGDFKCSAKCLYDVVQDSEYCDYWDDRKEQSIDICQVSENSDLIFYLLKFHKPFKKRDFVIQRCWKDYGEEKEKILYNHSVNHSKYPPNSDTVRAVSFITATLIKPTSENTCTFYFVTHADPGGLPPWIVNLSTKLYGPKFVDKLHKACLKYDKWKSKNNPNFMPWIYPEQRKAPMIDWNDIMQLDETDLKKNMIDESKIGESEVESIDLNDEI